MKAKNFKNGVSVIIKSDDLNLNEVVVNLNKETKEVRVFRKMEDGTVKELKKVRSTRISHNKAKTSSVKDTEPITSESHNINKVVPADETKRQVNWRKFRANIIKEGGIDTYMKSRRENNVVEELLLKYPDFKRGAKNGAKPPTKNGDTRSLFYHPVLFGGKDTIFSVLNCHN